MSQKLDRGFRERKRQATSSRITAAAARLTLEHGLVATTVEQISEEAEIGRATFFRYFDSKERAVAEGLAGVWLQMIIDALSRQAPELGPLDAVRAAFSELARGFADFRELVLSQAQLSRSSPALNAWTLLVYTGYEEAIAEVVTSHFDDITVDDLRPRLVGALVMASVRLALDDWVASEGMADLPTLIHRNLCSVAVGLPNSRDYASTEKER